MADKRPMFHTRFNVAQSQNKDKVYDRHDKVDRLSYVDSTVMVKRFIAEGKSLNAARAMALRSGLYVGDQKDIDSAVGAPIPVYPVDPAIATQMVDSYRSLQNNNKPSEAEASVSGAKATEGAVVQDASSVKESQE